MCVCIDNDVEYFCTYDLCTSDDYPREIIFSMDYGQSLIKMFTDVYQIKSVDHNAQLNIVNKFQ